MGDERDPCWPGVVVSLEQAIERGLYEPKDVVAHATPEVLVSQLPQTVMIDLLSRALTAERLTPSTLLQTASPEVLAEHLEPEVVWRCVREVAERAGLAQKGGARSEMGRQWLAVVLQRALDSELCAPADVMRHLPPAEFVRDTPLQVMAELIK